MRKIFFIMLMVSIFQSGIMCSNHEKPRKIKSSKLVSINPIQSHGDPYDPLDRMAVRQYVDSVCAFRLLSDNYQYLLKTFDSPRSAAYNGYVVTHWGNCGTCSTLQDLSVYTNNHDLTALVRKCSLFLINKSWTISCLKDFGFSDNCAETWYYNLRNTARKCFFVCAWSWLVNQPYNRKDGSLNSCLACDERESGSIFKKIAGRTRRNSGVESEIKRPSYEIRTVKPTH